TKAGYDFANLELQFFRAGDAETRLTDMNGATYNMEGGKMVVSKINKESKFTEKQDENFTMKKFALPNVKEGCIVEFKYSTKTDFFQMLPAWYFEREIPIVYSEYDLRIPPFMKYRINQNGDVRPTPKREQITQTFTSHYAHIPNAEVNRAVYIAENVPALKGENYTSSMGDYISKIEFDLNSVAMPGTSPMSYIRTWPKIVNGLKQQSNFGGYINKRDHAKEALKEILKDKPKADTVPYLIFNYVKNNLKWNNYHTYVSSESDPKIIFEKKIGNSADINLAMLAMFKEANIEAYPILISTRSNGKHPGTPSMHKFNALVIDAKIGDRHVFFDATSKNHTADIIAYDDLNHTGLKVDLEKTSGEWVNTEEPKLSKREVSYVLNLDKSNKLTGRLFLNSTNYVALGKRNAYQSAINQEEYLKTYKNNKPGLTIKDYKIENLDNPEETLTESMDVEIEDFVEEAGNLVYFNPFLFEVTKDNPFKQGSRKYPVDLGHPTEELYRFVVEVPKEYQLEKLPADHKFYAQDNIATFYYSLKQDKNRFILTSEIKLNKPVYTPQEYGQLRVMFENVLKKQAEQIVIKKI
ncbi:MAG: DUF3857 domain-containing protein, partial [Pedobacter sp.]